MNSAPHSHSASFCGGSAKRLQQELMQLMMVNSNDGVTAFPVGDSVFHWIAKIEGPPNSAYSGLTYKLLLKFSDQYPFKPPLVQFETPCFHPNIDEKGFVCVDILKETWTPIISARSLLLSLRCLLAAPNADSPVNTQAALLLDQPGDFETMVRRKHGEKNIASHSSL